MTGRTKTHHIPKKMVFPAPSSKTLAADVAAILASPELVGKITLSIRAENADRSMEAVTAVLQKRLLRVWTNTVEESHRAVWRLRYGLDGGGIRSWPSISAFCNLGVDTLHNYERQVAEQLVDVLWPWHEFYGLSKQTIRVVVYQLGITKISELYEQLPRLARMSIFRIAVGRDLDAWLRTKRRRPLAPLVNRATVPNADKFPGMPENLLRLVVGRLGIGNVPSIYSQIDELVNTPGFGIKTFHKLNAWLLTSGHLSLESYLTHEHRRKLDPEKKVWPNSSEENV